MPSGQSQTSRQGWTRQPSRRKRSQKQVLRADERVSLNVLSLLLQPLWFVETIENKEKEAEEKVNPLPISNHHPLHRLSSRFPFAYTGNGSEHKTRRGGLPDSTWSSMRVTAVLWLGLLEVLQPCVLSRTPFLSKSQTIWAKTCYPETVRVWVPVEST